MLAAGDDDAEPEGPDTPAVGGLAAVERLLEGKDSFKRRPRERVNAPTEDSSGRPLPEDELKKTRRCYSKGRGKVVKGLGMKCHTWS